MLGFCTSAIVSKVAFLRLPISSAVPLSPFAKYNWPPAILVVLAVFLPLLRFPSFGRSQLASLPEFKTLNCDFLLPFL
ncbi:hypothetical protein BKA61DRAFT_624621 [Leptodontidium sp. MPI-SDFR-AT-0119]|nr:hypothetical protein BKA61DRAFT_624621 [Leptodontidium sp. MPI-SDFR-AT-0119]